MDLLRNFVMSMDVSQPRVSLAMACIDLEWCPGNIKRLFKFLTATVLRSRVHLRGDRFITECKLLDSAAVVYRHILYLLSL